MINSQDSKFNFKTIPTILCGVVIVILIAFYYSNAQSKSQINFLRQEKGILIKDLTIMTADVDRLSALNEVNDIELQSSRYKVRQLLDSIGRLNFTAVKLREYKSELLKFESKIDSIKHKNNSLKYNNVLLIDENKETKEEIEDLRGKSSSLADADSIQKKKIQDLNYELKVKSYLKVDNSKGDGFKLRGSKPILTNKASVIEKLRGCVTIDVDPSLINEEKVIYFQFLGPTMGVIEDNSNTISVNGNLYTKRVEFVLDGKSQMQICDFITIPEGSLLDGTYTLNVFEDERLLSSTEFVLK